ncbi:DUF6443 domain-containing protein [Saccharicrinis sp. 156]|uniref:DUF6443 domain-containing protein n=1 Tax=Saccharicrinis sp. 156 TaxID=3417574 RepID=UPI003D3485A7
MHNNTQSILVLLTLLITGRLSAQENVEINDIVTGKAEVTATNSIRLLPGFHAVAGSDFHAYIDANAVDNTPSMAEAAEIGATAEAQPTSGKNYVRSITFREEHETMPTDSYKHLEQVQYFDGLGRPMQTIQVGASPLGKDIIQPIVYDDFGREATKYLPFVGKNSDGGFIDNAVQDCLEFYDGTSGVVAGKETDTRPFSFTDFENSPLNRVNSQLGAGKAWKDAEAKVSFNYTTNTSDNEISSWDEAGTPFTYPDNSLYITETTDENGNLSREYKDKLGQVVLKESVNGSETLQTYYIYDDFGLLRTVVPPLADSPADEDLCYKYTYDGRKRMISKEIPGAAIVYMVYDKRDRLVLTQDGNMRAENSRKYFFTKYDALNRPVMTGTLVATKDLDVTNGIRDDFKDYTETMYESYKGTSHASTYGYTYDDSYPSSCNVEAEDILTVTWYDNYDFTQLSGFGELDFEDHPSPGSAYAAESDKTKGVATGTMVKALEVTGSDLILDNKLLATSSYFDRYGNVIKTISKNHRGGYDVLHKKYEPITYQVLETIQEHMDGSKNDLLTVTKNFEYDHAGRLLETTCKVNNQDAIVLNASKYNELGELVEKYLHSKDVTASDKTFVQQVDYTYNIRGWMTSINDPELSEDGDLFGMRLSYNKLDGLDADRVSAGPQYNGNISAIVWGTEGDDVKNRGYGFDYDDINRLTVAKYGEGTSLGSNKGKYSMSVPEYDANGNIKQLKRYYNGSLADELVYTYENSNKSNRLLNVADAVAGDISEIADYVASSSTYQYDANGNMTFNAGSTKGEVKYNLLNLPQQVDTESGDKVCYHYDAAGNKLAKWIDGSNTTTEYIANLVYTNDKISFFSTEEGRAIPVGEGGSINWHFEYNLKDHLGNTRVTFGGSDLGGAVDIVQTSSYYPFGMVMAQNNFNTGTTNYQKNKYLYNGKELQDDDLGGVSLDWYDYGARFYDPSLGRFTTIDPWARKYNSQSPYLYAYNNPIRYTDYLGLGANDEVDNDDEEGDEEDEGEDNEIDTVDELIVEGNKKINDLMSAVKRLEEIVTSNKMDEILQKVENGIPLTDEEMALVNEWSKLGNDIPVIRRQVQQIMELMLETAEYWENWNAGQEELRFKRQLMKFLPNLVSEASPINTNPSMELRPGEKTPMDKTNDRLFGTYDQWPSRNLPLVRPLKYE